ncbi:hypothetical protein D9758_010756 [Tetrapyrgos nigripes]|uniref:Uncharacterized protein n=1 Tax=Tetrapyrgos nigripes TaxID=182062 RepID=A0A8H5FZG9_9AGAR|nr:hypothetical protein D9758_010756 [Tetrapyrgos nigripes]
MPTPCVTSPTPKELAAATQQAREASFGMRFPPNPPPPPPGAVRVMFYSHMYKVMRGSEEDMNADVMLEADGGLDINKLCKMWGLENCLAIDPQRWTVERRPDESKLSGVAVHVLTEGLKRPLMFTEIPVSKHTERIRAIREIALNIGNVCSLSAALFFGLLWDLFNTCTPIPYWYRKTHFYYTHIDWVRYRRAVKFHAIAMNNELTEKRGQVQSSAQGYVSQKRTRVVTSYEKCRQWCERKVDDLVYELRPIVIGFWFAFKYSLFILIPIFILYLMQPMIVKWERARQEAQWKRDLQLVFQ